MSKKSPKIQKLIEGLCHPEHDPHYLGFFACFNAGLYYEAHDVLEELWLAEGKCGPNYHFYKGLIQTAGAFVHLQKFHLHPGHHVHGKRLAPGARLFRLALKNLEPYPALHHGADLDTVRSLIHAQLRALEENPDINPWSPEKAPTLAVPE